MDRFWLFLKGMAMGAADVVPGVSGGTIAFISGIYDELLQTIKNMHPRLIGVCFQNGFRAFWKEGNFGFLLTLVAGILTSVITLARGISWLLENQPLMIWAFFFGLVAMSCWLIGREVRERSLATSGMLIIGALLGWQLTQGFSFSLEPTALNFFIGGAIAICAMILPGISGSFLLLILGLYQPVLDAVKQGHVSFLLLFMVGCASGLLGFSRFLHWSLHHHRNLTLSILTGFMLGSLGKVWPWKVTRVYRMDSHGDSVPLLQDSVLPHTFEAVTGQSSQLTLLLGLIALGAVAVWLLSRLAKNNEPMQAIAMEGK
ncbi:DUF368 domain-containing protein [Pokkaliibacter sp. CJK22405]|uniref:DUF368 domain-containing protein n=1 Tax=Pokkaliibacter sp. CJK22405 TaxID=3384615 RepID=UPI003984E108